MVAVVSGSGLGLFNTGGAQGDAQVGRGRDRVFVNTSTGNLVVQSLDENLVGLGVDLAVVRTYNSQGHADDDNGDNWRLGLHQRVYGWTGTLNTVGSTVRKVYGDGAEVEFGYDAARARYVTTDGDGQHDSLAWDAATSRWTFSDETGNYFEVYDAAGRLLSSRDNLGYNQINYIYSGERLVQVNDASNQQTHLDYDANGNLTRIRVISNGQTQILTHYGYDTSNRLQTVTVDHTPGDQSIADNDTYTTTYTYEDTSRRIRSITQKDGSSVTFTYQLINGEYRVHTCTDAEGRTTTIEYSGASTGGQVTVPADPTQLSTTAPQVTPDNYPLNSSLLTSPPPEGWAGAAVRETSATATNDPKIVFDAAGNGLLIRRTGNNIQAQRYTRATNSWSPEVTLDNRTTTANAPSLSIDFATGNAVAAWVQSDGTANSVYAARFDAASGNWLPATLIDVAPAGASFPVNATTGNLVTAMWGSRAAIAWLHNQATSGSVYDLYVARFDGTNWLAPQLVESQAATVAQPRLAIDTDGNIAVAFQQSDGTAASIYVNRFNAAAGTWTGAVLRETSNTATNDPRIAFDGAGNAILIRRTGNNLQAQRYTRATDSWGPEVTLDSRTNNTSNPALAVDVSGNAVAAWVQSDGTANSVYAARYDVATGSWLPATLIDVAPAGASFPVNTAVNTLVVTMQGTRAAIAWQHNQATSGSVYDMYVARFDGTNWLAPQLVENQTASAAQPSIGMDSLGNVAVAFQQADAGVASVHVNRYNVATTPYYLVQQGDTWRSIAAALYGIDSDAAGAALSALMPGQTLALNNALTSFPAQLPVAIDYPLDSGAVITPPLGFGSATPANLWNQNEIKADALGNTFLMRDNGNGGRIVRRFDVRTNTWSGDFQIDTYAGGQQFSIASPKLSLDAAGNAIASWIQRDASVSTTFNVYARTFSVATGTWSAATLLYSVPNTHSGTTANSMIGGQAVVAFNVAGTSAPPDIYIARFVNGAWQAAERVPNLTIMNGQLAVGVDADGDVQVITASTDATIFTVRNGDTGLWSTPDLLDASFASVQFDFQGNAIAQVDTSYVFTPVAVRRYDATSNSWGDRVTFPNVDSPFNPWHGRPLVFDADGNALLVWTLRNTSTDAMRIKYSRYDRVTNAWSAPQTLADIPAGTNVNGPTAAISGDTIYIGWLQTGASNADKRFLGTVGALTDISVAAYGFSMATLDRQGNALIVSRDPDNMVNARRYYTSPDPYYTIPAGATWSSIAQALYGTTAVADELQAAMGNVALTAGTRLSMLPARLNDVTLVTVAPHVVVQVGETWASLAQRVFGTHDANAVAALRTQAGNVPLVAGARIAMPANLQYVPVGAPAGTVYSSVDVHDALNRPTRYESDARGRLVAVTRPSVNGATLRTTYAYDDDGNLISMTEDAAGTPRTTTYEYDSRGNQRVSRDSLGNTVVRTYSSTNQVLTETRFAVPDPDGAGPQSPGAPQLTRYIYDPANNRLGYIISPEGRVTQFDYYGAFENKVARQTVFATLFTGTDYRFGSMGGWTGSNNSHPSNEITRYAYDFRGNVSRVTRAATHDGSGQPLTPRSETVFVYDQRGLLKEQVEARGVAVNGGLGQQNRTSFTYDGLGRLETTTQWLADNPLNGSAITRGTVHNYDDVNRRTSTTFANGLVTTTVYNRAGEVISVLNGIAPNDASLGTTLHAYDNVGQRRISTDPSGVRQFFFYDAAGRPAGQVDGDGTVTEFIYDGRDLRVQTVRYAVRLNPAQLAALVDGAGNPTAVTFATVRDQADGMPAEDRITRQVFDGAGRLVFSLDEIGAVTRFVYDGASQLVGTIRHRNTVSVPRGFSLSEADLLQSGSPYYVAPHADDRHGRRFYSRDGLLIATLDGDGFLVENEYDGAGHLVRRKSFANQAVPGVMGDTLANIKAAIGTDDEIVDDAERDATEYFFYDAMGRVIGALDAEGYFTESVYDVEGHLTQSVRYSAVIAHGAAADTFAEVRALALGSAAHATSFEYDGVGRLIRETNFEGTVTRHAYDVVDNRTSTTEALGTSDERTRAVRYDLLGRVTQELSGEGAEALIGVTDPNAIETIWNNYGVRYGYDAAGRRVSATTRPDGVAQTTYFYYDRDSRVQFELDALGRVTENVYDAFGDLRQRIGYHRPVSISGPQGGLATDALAAMLRSSADASVDSVTHYQYNARSQLRITATAEGATTTSEYNTFGELQSRTAGSGFTPSVYTYDHRGYRDQTLKDGIVFEDRKYDAFGRLCAVIDARGNASRIEYDRLGRTITTEAADGSTRQVSYDPFSRVLSTTDALQNVTGYSYDELNRRVTVTTPENVVVVTERTRLGQTFRVTAAGNVTEYQYDDDGRLLAVFDSVGTIEEHGFDSAGREVSVTDATGTETRFGYDAVNRRISKTVDPTGLNLVTTYTHDPNLRQLDVLEPGGLLTRTEFDRDGRVKYVTADPNGASRTRTEYRYDDANNVVLVIEGQLAGADTRLRHTRNVYDGLGRLVEKVVDPADLGGAGALNLSTRYRYDNAGNLIRKIDAEQASTWYVYDSRNRLLETIDALGGVTSLAYDAEGRIIETRQHAVAVNTSGFTDQAVEQNLAATVRDRVSRSFYDADGRERFTVATIRAEVSGATVIEHGVVTARTFDANGKVTQSRIYRNDITIPFDADTADIAGLISAHDEDRVASALYDVRGRTIFTIDAYRGITRNWYDDAGLLIRTTSYAEPPGGEVPLTVAGLTAWSDARAATPAQSSLDHTQAFWYDSLGRVRFALDAAGYLKETRYLDASRQVVDYAFSTAPTGMDAYSSFATVAARAAASVDTAHDRSTTTLRDAAGRVERVTQVLDYQFDGVVPPGSVFEQYTYDGVGNKRSYRNANGDVWRYEYDANGRLTAEFSPELWVTTVEASGNSLVQGREFVSVVTRVTYDNLGNVETRTEGIRRTVSTGVENLAGSRTTIYGYDLLGRQTSVTYPPVSVYTAPGNDEQNTNVDDQLKETSVTPVATTTYNTLGDAITNVDVSGAVSRRAYDELGRLRFEVDALGYVTEYTFDTFGNAVELTRHAVALGASAIPGEWTAAAIDAAVGWNSADRTIATEYDRLNRRTRVTQPAFISYTPDESGDVPGIYVQAIAENRYEYDAFGQLTRERKLLDQERGIYADTWFVYDNNGRRRYTVNDLRYVTEDQFDAFGNLTLHNEYAAPVTGAGPWTLASVQGAVQPTLHGDAHPLGIDRKTTYEYDSLGRLRRQEVHEVEFKTGSGAGTATDFGIQQTNFEYDAVGNRTKGTDHYGAVTLTYFDALGRIRAIVEPARSADTDGDYFTESGITPMTEMNRNAYGDLVEQVRYGSNPTLDANGKHVAPTGGAVQRTRMLLDNYGRVKRSQDGTLAPDGSLATKFFSYNVRGDVAKEWQIFTDADGTRFVQSVIREYDALGRETLAIQPQLRSDTIALTPTTYQQERAASWYLSGDIGQWIYDNKVNASWDPTGLSGPVRVYLYYTRVLAGGTQMGDTEVRSMEVDASGGYAEFVWTDVNQYPPNPPANGGIWSIQRIEVMGRNAQNQYTVLLRSSDGNPSNPVAGNSQVAYVQTRYNGFGEVIARGVNAAQVDDNTALQEYWEYDSAGHVWKSNADGVDKVYLYDVASRVTAEIRNQRDNFIRDLTDAAGAYYASDRMMTETLYNSLDQATVQRTPTFGIDQRLDPATTNVAISLVNGVPFLQWAGTLEQGVKTTFQYRLGFSNEWQSLEVVQLSPGVLGVDVHDLARVNVVTWQFQIVKSLSLQFAPFAISAGSFHVRLGETVTFGIEARENPRVATPVIGPGPASGATSFEQERAAAWYQTGDTGQWIYDNKVNAHWDPTGLSGPVRVYLFYTRVLAGGTQIGDTEVRSLDVNGSSGYAEFVWTDVNQFPPNPPANGGIWSIQRIEVYGQNAQGQYTVLLRGPNGGPPGPVRLRWAAPPAEQFANPVFYFKRADSSTWSNGITPTLSGGQLEVDVNALLVDDTVYDYRIEYWQQNTGILLARKEGQIDSTGLHVNQSISGTLEPDPLTGVFDSLVPLAEVNGLDLRWADPGAAVDEVEFRWGTPGSGTYPNVISVTRSGGYSSVHVGNLPPADYAYQVTYRIAGRTVAQQQNIFHLSQPQSTSTKSASITPNNNPIPQPAQPVATISGSNNAQTMSYVVQNSANYIRPNPFDQNYGLWVGPNRVKPTWASTGSTPVKVYVWYQLKDRNGVPATANQLATSAVLTSDPDASWVVEWWTPEDATYGGIHQIHYVQVYSVDGNGNPVALLRDSRSSGPSGPPRLTWAAPADTSLTPRFFFGLGLSQERTPTLSNGVYTVDLTGLTAATYDFEVHYYRPGESTSVSLAIGQFVTDGVSVTMNGAQQNILRDPQYINVSSSGNFVTWSRQPTPGSMIMFQYYDGSWQQRPATTTDGVNYSVDMTFLPNGTYNNMLFQLSYYTPGGSTIYVRASGSLNVVVSTQTTTPPPVLTRDATPTFNQKYPTQQITGVARSGSQITWNYPRQAGDRVFLRYQVNGGSVVELEQPGSGPSFAVTIPELAVDGTKSINWWVEYRSGSPGSARAMANGHGTLVVATTTTYPTTTLLSANDVYPTAINIPAPYQVGGVYSNLLRWDLAPEADAIVEFRLNGVVVNTLSPDRRQIDLTGYAGSYTYELTFRRPSQSLPYARVSGPITIGRAPAYIDMPAGLNQIPIQPESTPYTRLVLDRWGNAIEQIDGAVWNALNDSGAMQRYDVARLRTRFTYNVFGQLTSATNEDVAVLDTRGELDTYAEIPVRYEDVTSTYYYDMLGRQVATRDENGNVNGVTLNLAGQITGEQHADGGTKSFMYDAFGRQIQVQDEIGWRVRSIYDLADRQVGVQTEWAPELWLTREFTYDELGRRIAETSGEAADTGGEETTQYFYDLAGNLIRRRSERGAVTTYSYDVQGFKISERDAIGGLMRFEYDHFGNLMHKWDLANERTDYDYNGAGLLDSSTTTRANLLANQMDYQYDGAGHLTAIVDNATNRRVDYGYDTWGRMRRERTEVDGVIHQDTQSSFDSMNRLSKIVDLRYSLEYYYDAHGNRTLVVSNYLDHVHDLQTDNLWYTYDEMNRVKLSEGTRRLDNTIGLNELVFTADRGSYSEYFQNGQRAFTDQIGTGVLHYDGNGSYSYVFGNYREAYEYDGAGRLHAIWRSSSDGGNSQVEVRDYDGASRLIRSEQRRVNQSNTHFSYDDDGRMYRQVVRQGISDEGIRTSQTDFNIDAAGVQRSYLTTTFTVNGLTKDEYSYVNQYRLADGYLLSRQDVTLTQRNANGTNPNTFYGTIERFYDVNNDVVKLYDSNAPANRRNRHLANNLQGNVMTAIEGEFANDAAVRQGMKTAVEGNANLNFAQHFFHAQGQSVGSLGQLDGTLDGQPNPTEGKKARFFGIAMFGDSWAGGAARRPVPAFGSPGWQPKPQPKMNANFDVNFTEIGAFQASASDVVVQQGDTLRSIATRLFGDGNLWYLLADENGLTQPDAALQPGTNLRVPNQVYSLANTAGIFKPFDPNSGLDSKQATLLDPTPPPPKQPCGGHAKLILTVIAVVVTIIVAYFMGPASGPVAAFFQGMIAAVAGNAVSQGVAIGMGMQEGFNWKSAALAGVSGGLGGVIAPAVGQFMPNSPIAAGFVSGAIGSALTQGAGIALGLQESFSWRDVAIGAVSGAANAAIAKHAPASFNDPNSFLGDFGKSLVTGTTNSVVQAAFGGKVDGKDVVATAFGTALGNSIVRSLNGAPKLPGNSTRRESADEQSAVGRQLAATRNATAPAPSLSRNPQLVPVGSGVAPTPDDIRAAEARIESPTAAAEEILEEIVVTGYRDAPDAGPSGPVGMSPNPYYGMWQAIAGNSTLDLPQSVPYDSAAELWASPYIGAPKDVSTPGFAPGTLVPDTAVPMANVRENTGWWGRTLAKIGIADDPEDIYAMYSLPAGEQYDQLRGMLNSAMQLREGVTQEMFESAASDAGLDMVVQGNGMQNTYLQSLANGTMIATERTAAGNPVFVLNIYNPNVNNPVDITETGFEMWGADTPGVVATRMAIQHAMQYNAERGTDYTMVWGHSQGTAVVNEAVRGLERSQRKSIDLYNFGTATGTVPRALHKYRSVENLWDPVSSGVSEVFGGGGVETSRGFREARRLGLDYESVGIKFNTEDNMWNHSMPYYFQTPQARQSFGFGPLTPELQKIYSRAPWLAGGGG